MWRFRELFVAGLFFSVLQFVQMDTEDDRSIFLYPGKAKSERDLSLCKKREVCSIVHQRFWFPRQVERFCRCETNECSSAWSSPPDNYSMLLNNRAQMKFCEPIIELPPCTDNETKYLRVENRTSTMTSTSDAGGNVDFQISSNAECYCPPHRQWLDSQFWLNGTINSHAYRCSELAKCNADELCGFERTDYYAIYYHCSCPVGHLCVRRNSTTYNISKIFYNGEAFKALCTKFADLPLNLTNSIE